MYAKSDENNYDYIAIYFIMIFMMILQLWHLFNNFSLCRLGALIDIRKHFNIMETKTELLYQCHNPESKKKNTAPHIWGHMYSNGT